MVLTETQYNALSHILRKTKMDCWFSIRQKKVKGKLMDYCYDLENSRSMSLKEGLSQALDGFCDLESLKIEKEEIAILEELLKELKIIK